MLTLAVLAASLGLHAADFGLAGIFTEEMVLQQGSTVPVWGHARPGAKVTASASWTRQSYTAEADENGRWEIMLDTPFAGGPFDMEFRCGRENVKLSNVYSGEVWLASGQSNMSMLLEGYYNQPIEGSTAEILDSGNSNIHFINIPATMSDELCEEFLEEVSWVRASPATAGKCCAVAWFFARAIAPQLGNIPIGIINASYSGSSIEAWLSREAQDKVHWIYRDNMEQFIEDSKLSNKAGIHYNAMINPLKGYGLRGFLWYQGECNIFNVPYYSTLFTRMVGDWREKWGGEALPFYAVQIAPYDYTGWDFFTPQWPEISAYLREEQLKGVDALENSGLAVTLDLGEKDVIHPRKKKEVGTRLALMALKDVYGLEGFESRSPQYDYMEVKEGKAIIHFKNIHMGISSFGRELTLFEMAGEDRVFHPARAYVDEGNATVVVSCDEVRKPAAVRYAFKNVVCGELFGTGGLPVPSFRTDDWK